MQISKKQARKQGRDNSIKQFSTKLGLHTELFYSISSLPCFPAFADLQSLILLHFKCFSFKFCLCHILFSSRYMLELKFAIYYRAASLFS